MKGSKIWLAWVAIAMWCAGCSDETAPKTIEINDDRPCVKCDPEPRCTCDDGSDCPEGDKDKCSSAQACTCDDGSACPEGDKDKCSSPQACTCDDGADCPEGDREKCATTLECTAEKPGNAIDCECIAGSWTNCTYPQEPPCSEICEDQKRTKCGPEGVMSCEPDASGCAVWRTTEPCEAGTHCDESQMTCVKGCSDKCDINAPAKCENGSLVTCRLSATGCTDYQATACENGTYCDAAKGACVSCTETCKTSKRCSTKGVETCAPDAHGCAVWTLAESCGANQSCDEATLKCVAACNPACSSGQICDKGKCVCNPAMPEGWPQTLKPLSYPVMIPTKNKSMHGSDNIYAPDIHEVAGMRVMWYGAQGGDGHDRIFMAWSKDGAEWRKYPSDVDPKPVLDRGSSNHVNDPSLVHVGNTWKMYYTDAPTDINDRIWLAESNALTGFKKVQEVLGPGPAGAWDSEKVGRPAVLYENGVYKMWYDGAGLDGRHVGLATSTDGIHFTRDPNNPLFRNAGAIDVKKIGGVYVMLHEGQKGTNWATSVDGICWVNRGQLFGLSGASYDAYGQVTPFLEVAGGKLRAVWFGGASVVSWNRNRIGAAYVPGTAPSGGGCTACTSVGSTCTEACQSVGAGNAGSCGNPNSTTPGACCACSNDGCEKCVVGAKDCHQACVNIGRAGGYCAHPGSSDSSKCCACLD